ncbi:endonuclease/exonuclease/phosphatase family protein [Qipengyuania gelatinilytica]|uniref:Endonuclease/exonuclease/phosphatase family protein n=1 Tax=Qipengyuania gelatinilytica TaxID=2867231 RepID=A0ABX9A541_9SPHN|nr:endonuclease/exonuclease/phosphatase family protein [Qipengyuania gelatinilytica]QZD96132.1 endonuclease/exonuclease/phosphatase family protein [Qipengyuania gelatinilytica]
MVADTSTRVFINEFHYDNASTDTGEFIEIANLDLIDLTGWTLVLYNGSNGTDYGTIALSGSEQFTTVNLPTNGLQNGAPDGFALVDAGGNVVMFLSYEGSFTATTGPAAGLTSTDIGVAETSSTPIGDSLQLTGTGSTYGDFTWADASANTSGAANTGQVIESLTPVVFINEFHYDNASSDVGEFIEVAGTAGLDLTGYSLVLYNGSNGAVYNTIALDGSVIDDEGTGFGAVAFDLPSNGLQNGAPDGIALVAPDGSVLQFLSYEGTFVAVDGPAAGIESTDVGVAETGTTNVGDSLQLTGTGNDAIDFTWTGPLAESRGTLNAGQSFGDGPPPPPPPPPATGGDVFFNEFHYDNSGGDVGEAIELAGAAGTDLTGWSIVLYNGNGGGVYRTVSLSGIIPDQDDGFGTISFDVSGIQNGAPDGFALVDADGNVVQFLSYEGTMTATDGPAAGLTSIDVDVEEAGSPEGFSLQLTGTGSNYEDFSWTGPVDDSFGSVNTGQDFVAPNPNGSFYVDDASVTEGDSGTSALVFTVRRTGGTDGEVSVDYSVVLGNGPQSANAADLAGALSGTVTFAPGQTVAEITIQVVGDTLPEPTEFLGLELSNAVGGADIRDGEATGAIINDEALNLQIGEIQGEGHRSIYVDNLVTTTGIVTAVASNGFYMQDPDGDGNYATSDAIFVFTRSAPAVVAGDAVTVSGTVGEFTPGNDESNLSTTQITDATITVESSGNALPQAVVIGPNGITPPTELVDDDMLTDYDPATDGIDFWESLEGMLVTIENPVAIDSTNNFGELWTVASDGNGNLSATNVSETGLVVIEGGAGGLGEFDSGAGSDFNPERIQIDGGSTLNGVVFDTPNVTPGAVLENVTGVISYGFGNYELLPTEMVTVAAPSNALAEFSMLEGAVNQLTIATYNVLNLDINDADGDADVANGRFEAIAYDIGVAMNAPDIVVLEEIQDDSGSWNDGTVSAEMTLQALADAIFEQTGVRYNVLDNPFVEDGQTGGQPGGNIRVAFLYRADRVDLDPDSVFTIDDDAFARTPLVATFEFNGEDVTVIGNHFTSLIGSDNIFSANQLPEMAGALQRAEQAAALNAYVSALLAADAGANIVVAGDFNDFQFEETLEIVTGDLDYAGGMVMDGTDVELGNLAYLLDASERYSTLFQGNAQMIDHILASESLLDGAAIDIVHRNIHTASGVSDHDPVLARFNIGVQVIDAGNGADDVSGNDGNDLIFAGNGSDSVFGLGGDDELFGGNGWDELFGGDGNDLLSGGNGKDLLVGGAGNDLLIGGLGADTFVIATTGGTDIIADFGTGPDTILLSDTDGSDVGFVQNGADTEIYVAGALVAVVLASQAADVEAASEFSEPAVAVMPDIVAVEYLDVLYAPSDFAVL